MVKLILSLSLQICQILHKCSYTSWTQNAIVSCYHSIIKLDFSKLDHYSTEIASEGVSNTAKLHRRFQYLCIFKNSLVF